MKILIPISIAFITALGCNSAKSNEAGTVTVVENDTTIKGKAGQSVETRSPVREKYKPAFEGQTRVPGVKTMTPYKVVSIASSIGKPWAIIPFPGNRLLVTDKTGFMQLFDSTGKLLAKIEGLLPVVDNGQGGLLDVALDPDFANNRILYFSFSEGTKNNNLLAVAKGKLSEQNNRLENPRIIFKALPYFNSDKHFGSRLVFDREGNLFVSSGERSDKPGRVQAQDLTSGLGKIFKINKDGKAAAGNPYLNTANAMPEIFASGIRNAQGIAIHPVTGELWESEMGPRGGDEINIIRSGKDYGWPTITYGVEYSGLTIGDGITQQQGLEQPVYYWSPSVSPSGIDFYKGDAIPEWENNLFISCLSGAHIIRLVLDGNKVTGEERLLEDQGQRIRDVADGGDGYVYAVTDSGTIFKIGK